MYSFHGFEVSTTVLQAHYLPFDSYRDIYIYLEQLCTVFFVCFHLKNMQTCRIYMHIPELMY